MNRSEPHIRPECLADLPAIHRVNELAFPGGTEADLVDALRQSCPELLSLVAEVNDQVVGHCCFSPVTIDQGGSTFNGMGLGPVAVLPERQRQGIGSHLIEAGILQLNQAGCPFIVVLGHPDYYPRFGFSPASLSGIRCEWDVPDEAFMLLALDPGRMREVHGIARYLPEFSSAV